MLLLLAAVVRSPQRGAGALAFRRGLRPLPGSLVKHFLQGLHMRAAKYLHFCIFYYDCSFNCTAVKSSMLLFPGMVAAYFFKG